MTEVGTLVATLLTTAAIATGGLIDADASSDARSSRDAGAPTALVIDAALSRDGRDLVDQRLERVDGAAVRLPRTPAEARTNVRYFEAAGYRVIVAGRDARAAARGTSAVRTADLAGALAALGR